MNNWKTGTDCHLKGKMESFEEHGEHYVKECNNLMVDYMWILQHPFFKRFLSKANKNSRLRYDGSRRCITHNENVLLNLNKLSNECAEELIKRLEKIYTSLRIISTPNNILTRIRYNLEFEEVSYLGGGGYGRVFKAIHKLTGKPYAIKKIPIRGFSHENGKQLVNEAIVFANLKHENVAQYYGSWIQLGEDSNCCSPSVKSSYHEIEYSTSNKESPLGFDTRGDVASNRSLTDEELPSLVVDESDECISNSIEFRYSSSDEQSSGIKCNGAKRVDLVKFSRYNTDNKSNACSNSAQISNIDENSSLVPTHANYKLVTTLFIQMELGEESLQSWIQRRNEKLYKEEFSWTNQELQIFREILLALQYIHSKEILHRDIKPGNILLSDEGKVLLVDFGLATIVNNPDMETRMMSSGIGTTMYLAPEVSSRSYDSKVDIYSLGIILQELFQPFSTGSERYAKIKALKEKRQLDECLTDEKWKYFSQLVINMTEEDPTKRPSATDILLDLDLNETNSPKYSRSASVPDAICPPSPLKECQNKSPVKTLKKSKTICSTSPKASAETVTDLKTPKKYSRSVSAPGAIYPPPPFRKYLKFLKTLKRSKSICSPLPKAWEKTVKDLKILDAVVKSAVSQILEDKVEIKNLKSQLSELGEKEDEIKFLKSKISELERRMEEVERP